MKRLFMLFPAAFLALAACDTNDGPAEELGEEIDEVTDEAEDAVD